MKKKTVTWMGLAIVPSGKCLLLSKVIMNGNNCNSKIELMKIKADLTNDKFCNWLSHCIIVTGYLRYSQIGNGECCAIISLNSPDEICELADKLSDGDDIAAEAANTLLYLETVGFTWLGIDNNPLRAIENAAKKAYVYWNQEINK